LPQGRGELPKEEDLSPELPETPRQNKSAKRRAGHSFGASIRNPGILIAGTMIYHVGLEAGENHPEKGGSYPGTQISYFQNRS
jgi:hypothetical protein